MSPQRNVRELLEDRDWRGSTLYEERLKRYVEPLYDGQYIAIHVDSEYYAVAPSAGYALLAILKNRPDRSRVYVRRIGEKAENEVCLSGVCGEAAASERIPQLLLQLNERGAAFHEAVAGFLEIAGAAVEPMCEALRDGDEALHRKLFVILSYIGDHRAAGALCFALQDRSAFVRRLAAVTLGRLREPRAVEALIAALEDSSSVVRGAAAEALGLIGDSKAVLPLCATLRDKNWFVRRAAATSLGQLGDSAAVDALCAALTDDFRLVVPGIEGAGNWPVREAAQDALNRIQSPSAVEWLIAGLENADSDLRYRAALISGRIGDKRAVEPLVAALKDEFYFVRAEAAMALGRISDLRAIPWLCESLKDSDWYVQAQAAEALTLLGDAASLPRRVLSHASLSPRQRLILLQALQRVRYRDNLRTVRYDLPDLRKYCLRASTDASAGVKRGAKQVLEQLELLRATARNESDDGQELLRVASEDAPPETAEELLRASDEDSIPHVRLWWQFWK